MPYGSDPAATPEQLQKSRPATGGYGKDPIWTGLKSEAKQPEEKTSTGAGLWEGLKRGALDVVEQMKSSAARVPTGEGMTDYAGLRMQIPPGAEGARNFPQQRQEMISAADQGAQQSAQAYAQNPAAQQHPIASGIGRIGGNVGASLPFSAVPGAGTAGMLGRAAIGGATGGLTGGLPGAAAGAGLGAAGAAIGPPMAQAFQGIAQKFPNLAGMATGAMGRTPEAFQKATANEVLAPIGGMVDRSVKVGHDLVNAVGDKLDDAYNTILPKLTFRAAEPNPATGKSFRDTLTELGESVPQAHENDFTKVVKNQIVNRLDEGGNMTGEAYKKADREIGRLARRHSGFGATTDAQEYADVLRDLQANMKETLALHNPAEAPALQKIDQSWARYVRMQEAAGRRVDSNGEFMPNDLLMASRKGQGNRAFASGDQVMQAFGEAGNNLLGGKPTNFQKIAEMLGGAAGATAGAQMGIGGAFAGRDIGRELGSQVVGGAASRTVGPQSRELGAAVSRAAPVAGAGADKREPYVSPSGL